MKYVSSIDKLIKVIFNDLFLVTNWQDVLHQSLCYLDQLDINILWFVDGPMQMVIICLCYGFAYSCHQAITENNDDL